MESAVADLIRIGGLELRFLVDETRDCRNHLT
jgi:hypothetical protein